MLEPGTTLTDFLLAAVCATLALQLLSGHGARSLPGGVLFLLGMAGATLAGGVWHGFFSDAEHSRLGDLVWWLSMLLSGAASAGLALVGLQLTGWRRTPALAVCTMALAAYAAVTWRDPRFIIALAASLAGIVLCTIGLARSGGVGTGRLGGGLALALIAGLAQQRGVALAPPAIDHNATYHLALLPALALVYAGCRALAGRKRTWC